MAPFLHKPRSGGLPGEETSVCGEAVVNRDGATGGIARGFGNDRRLVTVLAFVALFAFCSYAHDVLKTVIVEPNFGDFGNYYFNAGKLNEGVNVFILTADEERRLRRESGLPVHPCGGPGYAPIFQFLMGFLARLDFWSALGLWLFLNHVLLACVLAAVPFLAGREPVAFFAAVFFAFASQPFLENICVGQSNLIVLFFLTAAALVTATGRSKALCGALIASALIVKPQYGLVLLLFLWRRDYRVVASAAACYAALRIAGVMIYGPDVEAAYWSHVFMRATLLETANISLKGVLDKALIGVTHGAFLSSSAHVTAALVLLAASLRVIPRDGSDRSAVKGFALLVSLVILLAPVTYEHYLVLLFIPFVVALGGVEFRRGTAVLFVAAFGLVSLRYSLDRFPVFQSGWPALLASGKTAGVFLAWFILWRHLRDTRENRLRRVPAGADPKMSKPPFPDRADRS